MPELQGGHLAGTAGRRDGRSLFGRNHVGWQKPGACLKIPACQDKNFASGSDLLKAAQRPKSEARLPCLIRKASYLKNQSTVSL